MTIPATTSGVRKALGRGLESLLPSTRPAPAVEPTGPNALQGQSVRDLPVGEIDPNPYQTRTNFDEQALNELAASILVNGIVQPIVVRPQNGRYQLVAGERRWRACQKLGREFIPAVIKQVSNEQAMEITIVENLQREGLNPMEEARAFDRLAREFNLTQEQMSQRTGRERASIANLIRLLRLPETVQQSIEKGELTAGHAKVLLGLDAPEAILQTAQKVRQLSLSVRQTEELVHRMLAPGDEQHRETQPKRPVDPNVRAAEEELQRALGMRVTIRDKKGKGKIVIEYASLEDFDRVVETLSR
ncbi:MAG TPA: ParB/RepB/Spo0J family partition protein [Terriglobales bacterium]|nr:ParB/RepB/Spo0J family partition protein [Terriglobales bacterium]